MSKPQRFKTYIAGTIMLLLGFLLLAFLLGYASLGLLPSLFLTGLGVIFLIMALLKTQTPREYEMSSRATLAYGVIFFISGILWMTLSFQVALAGYLLAAALIFFGLIFLAYTRVK